MVNSTIVTHSPVYASACVVGGSRLQRSFVDKFYTGRVDVRCATEDGTSIKNKLF